MSQRKQIKKKPVEATATTGFLLLVYRLLTNRFLSRHLRLRDISSIQRCGNRLSFVIHLMSYAKVMNGVGCGYTVYRSV
ncbi:hypothetical protein LC20_07570 [Yersinia hibernica]|uniref:Uncharacterized protein n=1 Tax=Yersinia enterocolitica LC20 TaxID=1443113 RepID=A0A7U5STP5_YEREN|nr:hypothetical protein LC20_07570 [Yersinia hibernica]OVZ91633.1 hypothetical protein CBW54_05270 [Yersinia kristensenii]